MIRSRRYSEHPPRVEYSLTAKGEDLRPIMRAMVEWGVRHAGGRTPPPVQPGLDAMLGNRCGKSTPCAVHFAAQSDILIVT